jgi:hypothetical protein
MIGFVESSGPTRSNPALIQSPFDGPKRRTRTSDQVGELLLESQTILGEPVEFFWGDYLDGGIDYLWRKPMVNR